MAILFSSLCSNINKESRERHELSHTHKHMTVVFGFGYFTTYPPPLCHLLLPLPSTTKHQCQQGATVDLRKNIPLLVHL